MSNHMDVWTGRIDGPGAEHARWHSTIQPATADATPGVVLLGFASDEGVRRNQGRVGAATAPNIIRGALGSLAVHHSTPLYDAGTCTLTGHDLTGAHDELTGAVGKLIKAGHTVIVLGGGHETAYGSHRGLRDNASGSVGIVNLDAHFDLRSVPEPTSGTPFRQLANETEDFRYSVFGISRPNNTRALFTAADKLNVHYTLDTELAAMSPAECAELVAQAAESVDTLHLSIDLDVLPAAVAPGVSAPAAYGVSFDRIHAMAVAAARSGKLRLVDVVELNPNYDIDGRTAKAAARLIDDIVSALEF
ncbi:formimidoylglutamase [Corynebacterium hindlerae]|uniref:formimidoylglutamase n=1 Tax=Corynebacterium hindlerae TaxID=699041 RepID=UPI001AD7DDF8|nr:formimidoylglutamase [Corynebacterium hindlerae]QTH59231.1 formimidoylglutamase [Corynebacterium hindlerae]